MAEIDASFYLGALAGVVFGLAMASAVWFRQGWLRLSRLRVVAVNAWITVVLVVSIYCGSEAWYFLKADVDGIGFTLATQRWIHEHRRPINQLGYRDDDYGGQDFAQKKSIVVVGDSFTLGRGIDDYRDRYTNVLSDRLGESYLVANVAWSGWDTVDETEALARYPFEADVVVLQYYLNDLKTAAETEGPGWLARPDRPTGFVGWLVEHSYFLNHRYWHRRKADVYYGLEGYWERMTALLAHEGIVAEQKRLIEKFVEVAREKGARVVVLIFPELFFVEESLPLTSQIGRTFSELGVPVIDLGPVFSGRDTAALICNRYDGHPNEAVHAEVAGLLFEWLVEAGWVEGPAR